MENTHAEKDSDVWPKIDVSLKMGLEMAQCNAGWSSWPEKKKTKHLHLPEVISMENTQAEKDYNIWPNEDVSLKSGLEMTQCNAGWSSWPEKRRTKNLHLPEVTSTENTHAEKDSNRWHKVDASLNLELEMTQCNAGWSSWPEKKKTKDQKIRYNSLETNDIDDNRPEGTFSIHITPAQVDSFLHSPINTCLSTDLEMTQHDAEVILSQDMDKGMEQNKRHNVLKSNEINQDHKEGGNQSSQSLTNKEFVERGDDNYVSGNADQLDSFPKCVDDSSIKKHDDHARVHIIPLDVNSIQTNQIQKQNIRRRKRRKFSDTMEGSLGFIEDGDDSSVLLVQDSSVRDTSLSPSNEAPASGYSEKMLGDVKDAISSSSQLGEFTDEVSLTVISKDGPQQMLQSSLGDATGNFRKKLLVLDVNGLLADIVSYVPFGYKPDAFISKKAVFKRPFCDDFLQFCFERFNVGVWSSRTKRNVESVLDFLMGKSKCNLLFCWDQFHCTDTGYNTVENREKPMLLKELKKLWEKDGPDLPWDRGVYNESNTLLLDDSPYKALRNPMHTAIFPHPYRYKDVRDNSLGPSGDLRGYLEGLASADNVQKYVQQNPFGQRPITEKNLSWPFYLKVISSTSTSTSTSTQQEEDANNSSARQQRFERNDDRNNFQTYFCRN
ncbi:hypothetical protein ACSBR1_024742 [Camellia fascicularis]